MTLHPAHLYAPGVHGPQDDEGSFAAGRQSLLDALQSLEQRAHDRAERLVRDAERTARQLTLDSEQRAYQLTSEAEERARQTLVEAEQRAKQATLETAQRLAELEQQLTSSSARVPESQARINPVPRPTIPRLMPEPAPPARVEEVAGPNLSDLRAAVDALKRPRREVLVEPAPDAGETADADETPDPALR